MPRALSDWLEHIERQHVRPIDLSLDRVARVAQRMAPAGGAAILTVGGTNGKGSTCAYLERILGCAGYRVGLYTSPHLLRYNERVRIAGQAADDPSLAAAFAEVERAREDTPLTYFEFGTLAAAHLFSENSLDAWILEVGMGGRLDAVNVYDADCAVITAIDMDHMDYLGATREAIAYEKAGILRAGRPGIVADRDPPASLLEHADSIGARLRRIGSDFGYEAEQGQWRYWSRDERGERRMTLAHPGLRGARQLANASAAIAALESQRERLPVSMQDIRRGLLEVEWPGRFQVLPGRPAIVLDVAHNPHAARALADNLGDMGFFETTLAVLAMLRDKDVGAVAASMRDRVGRWLLAGLPGPRGASAEELALRLASAGIGENVECFRTPGEALAQARGVAGGNDRIVVFGSFLTVADAMRELGLST